MPKQVSNEQLYDLMEDIYEQLPRAQRRYAVEDHQPAKAAPRESNVVSTLFVIVLVILIVALAPYAVQTLGLVRPASAPTTTTALPTASITPWPTQPASTGGAYVAATPVPAQQTAPSAPPACVPAAGGVDLHVGSDGASATIGNGQVCPETLVVDNAPAPDYGPNRDATGAWVGPTDQPIPTLAPPQATAFVAQFKPAAPNNAFVGYLAGRAPPTPWPTAPGPQPGDPDFASSFH